MKLLVCFFVLVVVLGGCSTIASRNIAKEDNSAPKNAVNSKTVKRPGDLPSVMPSVATGSDRVKISHPGVMETDQLDRL